MDLGSLSPFAHLAPPRPQLKCVADRPSTRPAGPMPRRRPTKLE